MPDVASYVQAMGAELLQGLAELSQEGTAQTVWNVTDKGAVFGSRAQPLSQIRKILVDSGQVYVYDGNVVMAKTSSHDGKYLVPIMVGDRLLRPATSHLSALFHCGVGRKDDTITYQVPSNIASEVLNNVTTRDELPRIKCYRRIPTFNQHFQLYGPGYAAQDEMLVHGENIVPIMVVPPVADRAINRLPSGLKTSLQDFCFDSDADLVNAVAMLLTGVLVNHFIESPKPIFVVSGNQRGLGKTLFSNTAGLILDGKTPPLIHHTDDEDEFGKRLGAKIKPGAPFSVLFFDNRKSAIGGGLLESLALASRVSVRLLGHNEDIGRPNDFIWLFTANNARATPDAVDRATLIRMRYEGDPKTRF